MKRVFHEILLVLLAFLRHLVHTRNQSEGMKTKTDCVESRGDNNDTKSD